MEETLTQTELDSMTEILSEVTHLLHSSQREELGVPVIIYNDTESVIRIFSRAYAVLVGHEHDVDMLGLCENDCNILYTCLQDISNVLQELMSLLERSKEVLEERIMLVGSDTSYNLNDSKQVGRSKIVIDADQVSALAALDFTWKRISELIAISESKL